MRAALGMLCCLSSLACSETITRRVIISADEAAALSREHAHVPRVVTKTETVTMTVEYKEGDVIPGEGIVRKTANPWLWVTGSVMMAAGTATFIGGSWWDIATSSVAIQGLYIAIAGGAVAAAGVGLTIAGLFPRAVVDKHVTITPVAGHGFGGGALALTF